MKVEEYPWVESTVLTHCSHTNDSGVVCKKRTGKFYMYRFSDWARDVLCEKHVRDALQAERVAAVMRARVLTQDARLGEFRLIELAARTVENLHEMGDVHAR